MFGDSFLDYNRATQLQQVFFGPYSGLDWTHMEFDLPRRMKKKMLFLNLNTILTPYTICPRSSDSFYIVSYYIKWVTTSWTHSMSTEHF